MNKSEALAAVKQRQREVEEAKEALDAAILTASERGASHQQIAYAAGRMAKSWTWNRLRMMKP